MIVTDLNDEDHMLEDYFFEKSGRDVSEYNRDEYNGPFTIKSELKVD